MKIRPCGPRLLVKIDSGEKKSSAGIIVDLGGDNVNEMYGTVVDIGEGCWKDLGNGDPWCKVGDRVLFPRHAGRDIVDHETGDFFRVIYDDVIAAVVEV